MSTIRYARVYWIAVQVLGSSIVSQHGGFGLLSLDNFAEIQWIYSFINCCAKG